MQHQPHFHTQHRVQELEDEVERLRPKRPYFKPPDTASFSGTSSDYKVREFLLSLEKNFKFYKVKPEEKLDHLEARLTKSALQYVLALKSVDSTAINTYEKLKTLLVERFTPINEVQLARKKLFAARQTGSLDSYVHYFNTLVQLVPTLDAESRRDLFINGLKRPYQAQILLHSPKTLMEAQQMALNLGNLYRQTSSPKETPHVNGRGSDATPMELDAIDLELDAMQVENMKCWACNEMGHLATNCSRRCTLPDCSRKQYHKTGDCTRKPTNSQVAALFSSDDYVRGNRSPSPKSQVERVEANRLAVLKADSDEHCTCCVHQFTKKTSLQSLGTIEKEANRKPLIAHGHLNGLPVEVMIDTGASTSHVSINVQKRLKLKPNDETLPKVTSATGEVINCTGTVKAELSFVSEDSKFFVDYHFTVCMINYDIVIGLDFLRRFKAEFNFKSTFPSIRLHHTSDYNRTYTIHTARSAGGPGNQLYLIKVDGNQVSKPTQRDPRMATIYDKFQSVFTPVTSMPPDRDFKHVIKLKPDAPPPVKRAPYRMNPHELAELQKQLTDMLQKGFIQPSTSNYNSRVLFVRKKDNTLRMVVDFRELNQSVIRNSTALPLIEDIYNELQSAAYFSKLDLESGYYQIGLDSNSRPLTAFTTYHGLFQFTVLPMGITGACETFQTFMRQVLSSLLNECVVVYLDDILVYSTTEKEHEVHLEKVFRLLHQNQLHIKENKCAFFLKEVAFLGNIVRAGQITPDPAKIEAITALTPPSSKKELQSFLGMVGYYNRYVSKFSHIAAPLTERLKNEGKIFPPLSSEELKAFEALKASVTSDSVLTLPSFTKPFYVFVDASDTAIGGCLAQKDSNGHKYLPVAFCSKKWTDTQGRYHAYDKELTALVYVVSYWKHYLMALPFTVFTDCQALVHLQKQTKISAKFARQLYKLSEFTFEIVHIQGAANKIADALSRLPSSIFTDPRNHVIDDDTDSDAGEISITLNKTTHPPERPNSTFDGPKQLNAIRSDPPPQVVSSVEERQDILKKFHDLPLAAHPGQDKTLRAIKSQYTWPNMSEEIKSYVRSCDKCQRNKPSNKKPSGLLKTILSPSRPYHTLSLDFLGPFVTSHTFDFLLVVVDKFSRYVTLIPTQRTITSAGVARLLLRHIIAHQGLFKKLISDRDVRFTSEMMKEFTRALGFEWSFSTSHHPQTDGATEVMNKTILSCLRHYVSKTQDDWAEYIPMVQLALNTRIHSSTGFSPFFLIYGRNADLSGLVEPPEHVLANEYVTRLTRNIRQAITRAATLIDKAQAHQKRHADQKRSDDRPFQQGEWVLLSTKNLRNKKGVSKLCPKFIGPFKVVSNNHPSYKLELPTSLRIHPVFHTSLLKRYYLRDDNSSPPVRLLDVEDEIPKGHYEVERILNIKKSKALVQWKGYPAEEASWVPLKDVHADELLQQFYDSRA